MTCVQFETVICHHCSPVLAGLKPSNLVSFSSEKVPKILRIVAVYEEKLKKSGICIEMMCQCRNHHLLLVYRPKMLSAALACRENREILEKEGYPPDGDLEEMLDCLKCRFREGRDFPHEIGLFLGYPLEDVKGFCKHNGSNCKFSGYWKVYGDVEEAKRMFCSFDRCREFFDRQIRLGYSITQVLSMNNKEAIA